MIYNLSIENELADFLIEVARLRIQKPLVDLKVVKKKRSLSQNNYLHLLIGAFGSHFGYTLDEAKTIYKQVNKSLYLYRKKGRDFWRSSADLTKEEMAESIDRFMKSSAEAGCPLPPATDKDWLTRIENEISKNRRYL